MKVNEVCQTNKAWHCTRIHCNSSSEHLIKISLAKRNSVLNPRFQINKRQIIPLYLITSDVSKFKII